MDEVGNVERIDGSIHDHKLVLSVDDSHKRVIGDDDAKHIFDLVVEAFILGSKSEHYYCGATYEFDRDNLTVIEHIDVDNRGEWL